MEKGRESRLSNRYDRERNHFVTKETELYPQGDHPAVTVTGRTFREISQAQSLNELTLRTDLKFRTFQMFDGLCLESMRLMKP